MISDADLADMRATLAASLPDMGTIQRVQSVSDDMGGHTDTWAAAGTVACRVSPYPLRPDEREVAGRVLGLDTWVVTMPAETVISERDRVATGGRSFEVVSVMAPRSWEVARRLLCTEAT